MSKRGFTILELLVVAGIIALLAAILIPSMIGAREQGKTALCAANMRSMGQIVSAFAAENDDRGPGSAYQRTPGFGVLSWKDILNLFYLKQNENFFNTPSYSIVTTAAPSSRTLSCPNFEAGFSKRQWGYNADANGGVRSALQPGGEYGTVVSPSPQPNLKVGVTLTEFGATGAPVPPWQCGYVLGAKLSRFASGQILIDEYERIKADTVSGAATSAIVPLGAGAPTYPAYCDQFGLYSFRHPYGRRANVLHFDAHVDMQGPLDDFGSVQFAIQR